MILPDMRDLIWQLVNIYVNPVSSLSYKVIFHLCSTPDALFVVSGVILVFNLCHWIGCSALFLQFRSWTRTVWVMISQFSFGSVWLTRSCFLTLHTCFLWCTVRAYSLNLTCLKSSFTDPGTALSLWQFGSRRLWSLTPSLMDGLYQFGLCVHLSVFSVTPGNFRVVLLCCMCLPLCLLNHNLLFSSPTGA